MNELKRYRRLLDGLHVAQDIIFDVFDMVAVKNSDLENFQRLTEIIERKVQQLQIEKYSMQLV